MALSIKEKKFECTFLVVILSLTALGMVCVRPVRAQYQGNIAINADGSVNPSTAPIQQTGDTYTLTGDVHGSISVLRSNMTFDGNGHSLIGGQGVGGLSVGCNYYSSSPVLTGATNVTVKNLNAKESVFGISLVNTTNALIFNNTISETGIGYLSMDEQTAGIYVYHGGSNVIKGNTLSNNYNGILFIESTSNLVVENSIANCYNPYGFSAFGILFWEASNNTIYHNNFLNNTAQAYSGITIYAAGVAPLAKNTWDNGFPSGGNYWSDYKTKYPNAAEIDSSGIGNTSYIIDSQNQDNYPLMEPFNTVPPTISVLSPVNQVYNESSVSLVFTVDKSVNWAGYSLDGKQNVTITGNSTVANLTNGLHSITVYANGTFGNVGASQTITFTIAKPQPFPTATVAAVSGAIVAVACVGLILYVRGRGRRLAK
jgi:parallel beta-helix repeat protein